ncbi:transcription-repair coupling factor [Alteromonas australica]|jgi:transcription-repair coupling factor (superfamily II helicase)|uniref:transcription-repair coupling factor n=1 Tax=Alteromonas TaxID=226 RepID=UPI0005C3E45F|nr:MULTISPECIES: transcription-repair coupling factor [Alteromonas]AJP43683.1 transcription-repair coupling factor [Alteromonas australica]QPL48510.1 transcription-repair coupling factor [Alteromonas sp. B31-7]|tara:strand:- start:1694 stop:5185 length:3492 start_codon:yes stop_codon:yes gene_type:complete
MTATLLSLPIPAQKKATSSQDHKHWGQLQGSSPALCIAQAQAQYNGPIVLITADTPSALKLEKELAFFMADDNVPITLFPDWETLPYDTFSPHQDIVSQRLETLFRFTQQVDGIFIVPINTLMQRLAPTDYLAKYLLMLNKGDTLDRDQFRRNLEQAGYLHVSQVMSHSEFSVRGSIIDLFPMGSDKPFRIDLFDDEVDSIRFFDTETQRSGDAVDKIRLLPAREFPTDKAALNLFRQQFLEKFDANNAQESVFSQVTKGTMPSGVEYYLPLFFEATATLFDYLHPKSLLLLHGDVQDASEFFWADVQERYEQYRYNPARPFLPPEDLFLPINELFGAIKQWPRASLSAYVLDDKPGAFNLGCDKLDDIAINSQKKAPAQQLINTVNDATQRGAKVLFCAETQGRKEGLLTVLRKAGIKPSFTPSLNAFLSEGEQVGITVGMVEHSFRWVNNQQELLFITETELLGHKVSQRRRRDKRTATDESAIIRNLAELSIGQPVVHLDHGVGRYLGLQTLDAGGVATEYLCIEYAKQSKLYVPVASLHLISRYTGGDADTAPINALGSDAWSKAKQKAAEKVRDVAAELLDVYARRAAKPGFAYPINWEDYQAFADSFPFEETPDQAQAIAAVIHDMGQPQAMDRLVCGDVGFGKTEVAMRAAFLAANQGKQVAILVPTTLLAQQHHENFKDRFAAWPFEIEVMSRFVSGKAQKSIIERIAEGKVDIVVGTHKLLSSELKFNDLGLVIIDEEHRFGVRQKEKLKSLRADVDILTLTATPIPRTLNMALSGMRDLSIIATAPARRLSIKTFVQQRNKAVIREAIMREILRGGQVYFLHNEVDTIARTVEEIAEIVPEARIAMGHGQMRERELESVMSDFYHQRYNVLVCTTIIETGIDVPTANTIIMDRADHLGLAQLHQLRGRVGRSHHQAYAYLLTPHPKRMTKDAVKRLDAISQLEDLGAGFALATHDLEIRGAGELLGDDQSGQIASIGFSLYMDMLDKAVTALKNGKEPSLDDALAGHTEIELRIPALLPEDYIADVNTRLSLYKRLAGCTTQDDIDEFQVECIDRFGLLPDAAKNLVQVAELKIKAEALGILKVDLSAQGGTIEFKETTKVDPGFIIQLVQTKPNTFKFEGSQKLRVVKHTETAEQRIALISGIIADFAKESR